MMRNLGWCPSDEKEPKQTINLRQNESKQLTAILCYSMVYLISFLESFVGISWDFGLCKVT